MCQLKKLRANEITEPLAFSVCKLELRWKAIVLHSSSRHTRFNRGQLWEKRKESDVLRQNKTNQGASAAMRVQGGTRFCHGQQKDKTKGKNVLPQNKNKPWRKCRGVVSKMQGISYNEESNDEE